MGKHYEITPDMTPEQVKALLAEYWKDRKPRYATVQKPPKGFDMEKFRGLFSDMGDALAYQKKLRDEWE